MKKIDYEKYDYYSYPDLIKPSSINKVAAKMKSWVSSSRKKRRIINKFVKIYKPSEAKIYTSTNEHWFLIKEKNGMQIILVVGFKEGMFSKFHILIRRKQSFFRSAKYINHGFGASIIHDSIIWVERDKKLKYHIEKTYWMNSRYVKKLTRLSEKVIKDLET